jgi:V/A-type H+-transporting ATPase subunit C
MNSVMTYSGIVTKIRAMRGKLLKEEDYQTIASMRPVTEVFSYLKENTSYGSLLERMDDSLYHRGNVEKVLVQSLYDDYTSLYRFANQKQREFLRLYKKRYEVDLINHCLRMVFHHYGVTFDLDYKKPFFHQYSNLDIDRLITSATLCDLVENLSGTEYYAPLSRIQKAGAEQFFDYDLALNLYYFSVMWKKGEKMLEKKDLELFKKTLGTEIDCLNLQWIYRAKKYYHMTEADLFVMLIPIRYHLSLEDSRALVGVESLEEFFRILNERTFYGRKYFFDEEHGMEEITGKWMMHLYETAYRNHPYSVASIYNYLYLKEQEIHTITTAIECIRYGLSESETLAYIRERRVQT